MGCLSPVEAGVGGQVDQDGSNTLSLEEIVGAAESRCGFSKDHAELGDAFRSSRNFRKVVPLIGERIEKARFRSIVRCLVEPKSG